MLGWGLWLPIHSETRTGMRQMPQATLLNFNVLPDIDTGKFTRPPCVMLYSTRASSYKLANLVEAFSRFA
jgi:hypothetical protein